MLRTTDFYALLQISRDASPVDIKIAYHHTLLRLHPDKQSRPRYNGVIAANPATSSDPLHKEASLDVSLLKEAYKTLSDVGLRAAYDSSLRQEHARSHGPRPAQVISLEEFTAVVETFETGSGTGMSEADTVQEWWYKCRCGGTYRITQGDLESGTHLVGCESCSEVIWVGYEEAPVTDEEEKTIPVPGV